MSVPANSKFIDHPSPPERGRVLIVEDNITAIAGLKKQLVKQGFDLLISQSGKQAIELLDGNNVDIIFMKTTLPDMHGNDLVQYIKTQSFDVDVPIVLLVSDSDQERLLDCMVTGGDDFLNYKYTPAELNARIAVMEQLRELKHLYKSSIHEQVVAKQILSAALSARDINVDGMQVLSRSAAIFSGDLVLSAYNPNGSLNILLADFTGHGLSAAIGVLPVADMFSVMTEKGFGPEIILKNINNKLYTLLPTGMFMAACMVEINSSTRNACVWNSGMPDVYLMDSKTGLIKRRIKSTHIPLGIIEDIDNRLEFDDFDIAPGDHFVLHSDGLTDAIDSSGDMFGTNRLLRIIEEASNLNTFHTIVSEFNRFCGDQALSDDVTAVTVPCGENLIQPLPQDIATNLQAVNSNKAGWRFMIEVSGSSLREINPVPIILDQYNKLDDLVVSTDKLQSILYALYDNALNHGVLELSHLIDSSNENENRYHRERDKRFDKIPYGFVRIELQQIVYQGNTSLLLRLEDSGRGFDHVNLLSDISDKFDEESGTCKSGIPMVKELCQSLHFQGRGNRVEVIVGRNQHSGI